jgi:hypothetical protein
MSTHASTSQCTWLVTPSEDTPHQKQQPVGDLELPPAAHDRPVRPKQVVAADKVHKGVPPVAAAVRQVLPDVRGILISARDDGLLGVGGGVPPGRAPAPVEVDKSQNAALGKVRGILKLSFFGREEGGRHRS